MGSQRSVWEELREEQLGAEETLAAYRVTEERYRVALIPSFRSSNRVILPALTS